MKSSSYIAASLTAFLFLSECCLAHKVSVFAFVDGDEIQVECGFSRIQRVRNGRLVITDLETGGTVLEGVTDERGLFRFRPPDEFLATGHGLNIRLFAGEGHQDDWKISSEELRALSRTVVDGASPRPAPAAAAIPRQASANPEEDGTASLSAAGIAELEEAIGRVMDAKLAPVKQALARQQDDEPGLRDIVGGIGWILGLLGLATYMKYRR